MPIASEQHLIRPALRGEGIPVHASVSPRLGMVLGTGRHTHNQTGTDLHHLCVLDLDARGYPLTLIRMGFFGHGMAFDPVHPERLSLFEKRGKGACEISLAEARVTRTIETAPNRQFYGHGAYSPDGGLLYATETLMEGGRTGLIAVRDAVTHDDLGEFPSYGASPHDCRLIEDGATLVITNGGGEHSGSAPCVTYVDIASQKLLERLEFDTAAVNAGHLDITHGGELAVVSAQRDGLPEHAPGGVSLRRDNALHTLTEPAAVVRRLQGETLSVCIHGESGVVAATTPAGNLFTLWELGSGRLLRHHELQSPRGVELSRDGNYFIVSYGSGEPPEALCLFSTLTLEKIPDFDLSPTGITGSHLYHYSLPAR